MSTEPPQRRHPSALPSLPLRKLEATVCAVLGALSIAIGLARIGESSDAMLAQTDVKIAVPEGSVVAPMLAALGFVILSMLFTMCEAAMGALKPHHLKRLPETSAHATRLGKRMERRPEIVAALAFGNLISRLGQFFCGLILTIFVAAWLEKEQAGNFGYGALALAAMLVAGPLLLLQFLVGVLIPRALGNAQPLAISVRLGGLIAGTTALLGRPARLLVRISEWFRRLVSPKQNELETANEKEEEIKTLVDSAEESGAIQTDEKELITSVFEFTDTVAREVMTPRTDLDAMPITTDPKELVEIIQNTGHSRIPLYEGTDDNIVGIVHAKDLLLAMVTYKPVNLRSLMRGIIYVPESRSLHALLREMRGGRTQLAVVQDEFGGTAGIVTIEDIIEELVGEIQDEYDVEDNEVSETPTGYIIEGKTHIDDVNEKIGTHFESEDFDTIGGFVFGLFGRQPKVGEDVDAEGFRFTVAETDGRRIIKLRLEPCPPESA